MDGSIRFLAMPRIGQALTPTANQAWWIFDIHGFAVGSPLIVLGNIGDRHGRMSIGPGIRLQDREASPSRDNTRHFK
ncbi:hypothetical protein [Streptosporangium sp. NBC_01756]|uniref:hypothetical protein n=1 Tax=Streptosporangium sp. NBC_01756 TaxID=2975950 RepID=UPI002DDAF24E|nr:hypothetical protein [Streptosporangium sp. NBC_01756]WSC86654.1 hypothetical protein OIE48_00030 [Streptosporangium sp. NBC_01756]